MNKHMDYVRNMPIKRIVDKQGRVFIIGGFMPIFDYCAVNGTRGIYRALYYRRDYWTGKLRINVLGNMQNFPLIDILWTGFDGYANCEQAFKDLKVRIDDIA